MVAIKQLLTTAGMNFGAGIITALVAYLIYKYSEYLLQAHLQATAVSGPLGILERSVGYAPGLIIGGLAAKVAWVAITKFVLSGA